MATHRNRYIKVALFEKVSTNLMGATIVGQLDDTLIVERPQPKPRTVSKPRKPRTNAKAAPAPFPAAVTANG
jgi:hypothetical protein